jgi:predicted RNA-binding protein YlxR (DUF448 family)
MATALSTARQETKARAAKTERRCLVAGDARPKDELIRFVVGPDRVLVPDLAQNLPGRGLWVTAARAPIEEAARKNLFARAAKTSVKSAPDLADQVATLLQKRCLEFLGLARGAGIAVFGQPQVEAALKTGKITLLLLARDAKAELKGAGATVSQRFTRDELGAALGHDQLAYVGLKAHGLTEKLRRELARLDKMADKAHTSGESDIGNS